MTNRGRGTFNPPDDQNVLSDDEVDQLLRVYNLHDISHLSANAVPGLIRLIVKQAYAEGYNEGYDNGAWDHVSG